MSQISPVQSPSATTDVPRHLDAPSDQTLVAKLRGSMMNRALIRAAVQAARQDRSTFQDKPSPGASAEASVSPPTIEDSAAQGAQAALDMLSHAKFMHGARDALVDALPPTAERDFRRPTAADPEPLRSTAELLADGPAMGSGLVRDTAMKDRGRYSQSVRGLLGHLTAIAYGLDRSLDAGDAGSVVHHVDMLVGNIKSPEAREAVAKAILSGKLSVDEHTANAIQNAIANGDTGNIAQLIVNAAWRSVGRPGEAAPPSPDLDAGLNLPIVGVDPGKHFDVPSSLREPAQQALASAAYYLEQRLGKGGDALALAHRMAEVLEHAMTLDERGPDGQGLDQDDLRNLREQIAAFRAEFESIHASGPSTAHLDAALEKVKARLDELDDAIGSRTTLRAF